MRFRLAATVAAFTLVAVLIAACGANSSSGKQSATDKASGLTVTVTDDHVSLKRTAKSTAGTGGTSATVSCTDDYAKLVKATAVPAPSESWYATTLITWPAGGKESSARLSHKLDGDPQLCVAQTSDSSASAVVYFDPKVKAGLEKVQTDGARKQQAAQATAALQSAARAAVGAVSTSAFPDAATLVQAITAQGLYAKPVATAADAKDTGTVYVITSKTTKKTVSLVVKDGKGKAHTATQGVKGSPKVR
jgi:hypothetical protein